MSTRFRQVVLAFALLAVWPSVRLAAWQCPTGAPPPCNGPRTPAISPRSIAVLYLANRSADSADAYLADGLTEEIIARLSRISRLEVKSRTAVERFRRTSAPPDSLGRALRVAHLVSGTMQHVGRQLRVTVELVRASTGVTTWAGRFDRSDENLLDIETAIADTIAREVAGRLLPAERGVLTSRPTRNAEAYDRFVRGNYLLSRRTPEDTRLAIREYEAAVQLDPRFAAAQARIALAHDVALDWGWPGFDGAAAIRAALAASSRALELDSTLADGWTARGYVLRFANAWTYAGVRESFSRAIALAPRDAEAHLQYGWALAGLGDRAGALAMLRRSVSLDPDRAVSRFCLGWVLLVDGQLRKALPQLDSAFAVDPSWSNVRGLRAMVRLMLGDTAGARQDIRDEGADVRFAMSAQVSLLASRGDSAAARATADARAALWPSPPARVGWGAWGAAMALAAAGEADRTVTLLERIEPQGLALWWMMQFPAFDRVRHEARFARLEAELAPPGR